MKFPVGYAKVISVTATEKRRIFRRKCDVCGTKTKDPMYSVNFYHRDWPGDVRGMASLYVCEGCAKCSAEAIARTQNLRSYNKPFPI